MFIETSEPGTTADRLADMTAKEIRSALLLGALLIGVPTALGCFIIGGSSPDRERSEIGACMPIEEKSARLTCYDQAALNLGPEPFKGAVAPLPGSTIP